MTAYKITEFSQKNGLLAGQFETRLAIVDLSGTRQYVFPKDMTVGEALAMLAEMNSRAEAPAYAHMDGTPLTQDEIDAL